MRKVQLEMGGKNPLVVLDDADLDTAVDCAVNGAYFSTGQRCTASSRFIVTDGIHDRFVDATIAKLKSLSVDDARKDGTHIGPVVDQSPARHRHEVSSTSAAARTAPTLDHGAANASTVGRLDTTCSRPFSLRRRNGHAHQPGGDLRSRSPRCSACEGL